MSYTNNIIKMPVTMTNIATCLGSGSRDLGTLCKASAIHQWAKYKPIQTNIAVGADTNGKLSEAQFMQAPNGTGSTPYGLTPGVQTRADYFIANFQSVWAYTKPSTYYRMLDFDLYCDRVLLESEWGDIDSSTSGLYCASTIFGGYITTSARSVNLVAGANISFDLFVSRPSDSPTDCYLLYPADFSNTTTTYHNLVNFYPGIALVYGNSIFLLTTNTNCASYISAETYNPQIAITVPVDALIPVGSTFYAVPVLCYSNVSSGVTQYSGTSAIPAMVTLNGRYLTFTKASAVTELYVSIDFDSYTSSTTRFKVSIVNSTGSSKTITALYAYLSSEGAYNDYQNDIESTMSSNWNASSSNLPNTGNLTIDSGIRARNVGSCYATGYSLYNLLVSANGGTNVIANGANFYFYFTVNARNDAGEYSGGYSTYDDSGAYFVYYTVTGQGNLIS